VPPTVGVALIVVVAFTAVVVANRRVIFRTDNVQAVTDSGLRGRGCAAFPNGIKWKTVLDQTATQKYITCNADEGDSGTFADRMLMEGDPLALVEGMTIAGIAVMSIDCPCASINPRTLSVVACGAALNAARLSRFSSESSTPSAQYSAPTSDSARSKTAEVTSPKSDRALSALAISSRALVDSASRFLSL